VTAWKRSLTFANDFGYKILKPVKKPADFIRLSPSSTRLKVKLMRNSFFAILALSLLFIVSCSSSSPKTTSPNAPIKAAPTHTVVRPDPHEGLTAGTQIPSTPRTGSFIASFEQETIKPAWKDPNIAYDLDPSRERFFVHVPAAYSGKSRYGLVVFIHAGDRIDWLPDGWSGVLDARNFIFIAPENAGNEQYRERRLGLGVLSALEMMKHYQIDANRVYISGFSGGARMAGLLGFFQSDIFRGTIQNCGADFYQHVPQVYATSQLDTAGQPYGFFSATADEVRGAERVRFVLITGSEDFRRGNILDVFNGGFVKTGFQAKLFDVPGMSHEAADARTLNAALDFLEALH